MTNKVIVEASILKKLFYAAKSCISSESNRPILNYAKIQVSKNEIYIESCDGYKLMRASEKIADTEQCFEFLVKPFAIPKGAITISIAKNENLAQIIVQFKDYDIQYNIPQPEEIFLDLNSLRPQTHESLTACVSASNLINALTPYAKNDRKGRVCLRFSKTEGGIDKTKPLILSNISFGGGLETIIIQAKRD